MFARISTTFVLAASLSLLAVASPHPHAKRWDVSTSTVTVTVTSTAPGATVTSSSECDTGALQCCNSVESVSASLFKLPTSERDTHARTPYI